MEELLKFFMENSLKFMIMVGTILIMFTTKNHFPKNVRRYTVVTFALIFAYSFIAAYEKYLTDLGPNISFGLVFIRRIMAFLGYTLRPLIIEFAIFVIYDISKKKKILFSIPVLVNGLVHLTGLWMNLAFTIKYENGPANNEFIRGPLGYLSFVVIGIYCLFAIYVCVVDFFKGKKQEGITVLFILICCIIGGIMDLLADSTSNYLGNALCISVLFYYLYLNVEYARRYEIELVHSQQNELVLSQVRPHFMYNVLTSIYYLCDHDPQKAKKAVNDFSLYLRHNLDTMRGEQIVEFENELSYVQYYLALEKIRFEEELSFDYDLETTSFSIPKFTLQPIVENAVKHGVSQKVGGGHILIYTKDEGTRIKVGVKDDGVGFDVNQKPSNDGRSHVGVKNISYRLMEFLGEELHIESKVGEGTHVYFYVNKK